MRSIVSLLLVLFAVAAQAESVLLYNINGYTMDNGRKVRLEGIEYEDGVITKIYRPGDSTAGSEAGQRIDGAGRTVLPGLIDAHGHVGAYGDALGAVDLTGSSSEFEAAQRVATFIDQQTESTGWILGRGWNQVLWPGKAFPARAALDAISKRRPIALGRVDGHALWVNSAALEIAGIDRDTEDPEGGQIVRDADGEPTGVLIDNAMDVVWEAIGEPTIAELEGQLVRGMKALAATGLTTVHDAGISARTLEAYRNLQRRGELPIRAYPMLSVLDPRNDPILDAGPSRTDDGMLMVRSVKISADGALGSRGAALHEDYSDQAGHRGLLLLSDEELARHIRRSAAAGFQVNVHAIGDLANTRVLDEFEAINIKPKVKALRHRIEHAQIIRPEDLDRFADLGVIASIQPTHATSDKNMAGDRLGEARLEGAYAWQTLLRKGTRLAGGSDFPVEPPNPLFGLHAAVTRTDRAGDPLGGWRPQEKLSREASLSLFTEWAAYASHEEQFLGRLMPGYAADFVVLEADYFEQPEQEIWRNRILATVVAGNVVFAHADSPL